MRRLNAGCEMWTDSAALTKTVEFRHSPKGQQVVEVEVDGHDDSRLRLRKAE